MTTISVTHPDTIGVELAKRRRMRDDPIKYGPIESFDDDEDEDEEDGDLDEQEDDGDDDTDEDEEEHNYHEDDDDEGEEWKRGRQSEDE